MILDVLTKEDCEQVRLWRNQSLVALRTPYPLTAGQQEDFYRDVVCNRNSRHRYWGIYSPDVLIGTAGLTFIEWENRQAEISLILAPTLQKQGYGKQAVHLILDQAFNYLNLELVYGECYKCNQAWQFWEAFIVNTNDSCCELRKGKYWKGKRYETLYFDITKEEFNKCTSQA